MEVKPFECVTVRSSALQTYRAEFLQGEMSFYSCFQMQLNVEHDKYYDKHVLNDGQRFYSRKNASGSINI